MNFCYGEILDSLNKRIPVNYVLYPELKYMSIPEASKHLNITVQDLGSYENIIKSNLNPSQLNQFAKDLPSNILRKQPAKIHIDIMYEILNDNNLKEQSELQRQILSQEPDALSNIQELIYEVNR